MSELLFEGYGVPSVCYGIDALFALLHGQSQHPALRTQSSPSLVVSSGFASTVLLPFNPTDQFTTITHGIRLGYGGSMAEDVLLRAMQTKYPTFPAKMTTMQARSLVQEHLYMPSDYVHELLAFEMDSDTFEEHIIQFPFQAACRTL
jgi:actin-related protein 5